MSNTLKLGKRVAITAIAGFLILLHVVGLVDVYASGDVFRYSVYENFQATLSVLIILSLTLVILGKPIGMIGMWVTITTLIISQYWAHFGFVEADFTEGRSAFSYLRGFMIPTVITVLYYLPFGRKT